MAFWVLPSLSVFVTQVLILPDFQSKRSLISQGVIPITVCDGIVIPLIMCSYMSNFFLLAVKGLPSFKNKAH